MKFHYAKVHQPILHAGIDFFIMQRCINQLCQQWTKWFNISKFKKFENHLQMKLKTKTSWVIFQSKYHFEELRFFARTLQDIINHCEISILPNLLVEFQPIIIFKKVQFSKKISKITIKIQGFKIETKKNFMKMVDYKLDIF